MLTDEQSDWTPHNGGKMPVEADTFVSVKYRDGGGTIACSPTTGNKASYYRWEHDGSDYDIVAYRLEALR